MKKYVYYLFFYLILAARAHAGIVFESATGSFDEAACCSGSNIDNTQFIGSVFFINEAMNIDGIGGHFNNTPSFASLLGLGGSIFGAIVNLDINGLPYGNLTSIGGVIASTVFTPDSGTDTVTSINTTLSAGTYGLVFGSGLFGANGKTLLTLLQPTQSQYLTSNGEIIGFNSSEWGYGFTKPNAHRMFVTGSPVAAIPEPETYITLTLGLILIGIFNKRSKRST